MCECHFTALQCAQTWGLSLPVVQDADFGLPPHIVASQAKNKKRKRDDSKKASKGTPAFLRVQTPLQPFRLLLRILTMPSRFIATLVQSPQQQCTTAM